MAVGAAIAALTTRTRLPLPPVGLDLDPAR